jgi:cytochrome bd-type quinol oxidase subunit 1
MKKLISLFAALALVGSLTAQKKAAKAPAKAPAAPAVAAPKAPAAPEAPAVTAAPAAKAGETNWTINAWGGYNIVGETDFTKQPSGVSEKPTRGGVAGGLDVYYGKDLQFGLGVGYVSYYRYAYGDEATIKVDSSLNYVPVLAQVRYLLGFGLYVGAGAGIASTMGEIKITIFGATATASLSGSAIALAGLVGYQIGLGDNLALDLGARVMYLMQDIETTIGGTTTTTKNNSVNIIPNLGVTYKF